MCENQPTLPELEQEEEVRMPRFAGNEISVLVLFSKGALPFAFLPALFVMISPNSEERKKRVRTLKRA